MKLYATITSERASKGQGGKYLDIDINGERGQLLWRLQILQKGENATLELMKGADPFPFVEYESETPNPTKQNPKARLEYLRKELRAERISYGELVELQSLAKYIDKGDVELLEAAGVPEFPEEEKGKRQKGEKGMYQEPLDIFHN